MLEFMRTITMEVVAFWFITVAFLTLAFTSLLWHIKAHRQQSINHREFMVSKNIIEAEKQVKLASSDRDIGTGD